MASSITMPTISVSASMVIWFSVNPMAAISAKVEMMEVGIATAAISVVRHVGQEQEDDDRREDAAFDQVVLDVVHRRLDEDRLIGDDLGVHVFRQQRPRFPSGAP